MPPIILVFAYAVAEAAGAAVGAYLGYKIGKGLFDEDDDQ